MIQEKDIFNKLKKYQWNTSMVWQDIVIKKILFSLDNSRKQIKLLRLNEFYVKYFEFWMLLGANLLLLGVSFWTR